MMPKFKIHIYRNTYETADTVVEADNAEAAWDQVKKDPEALNFKPTGVEIEADVISSDGHVDMYHGWDTTDA